MNVDVSQQALADLREIHAFVAADNAAAADALVARLLQRARAVGEFPLAGRRVPEWSDPAVREVIEGRYRIVYRIEAARVVILTVWEGHRLLRR